MVPLKESIFGLTAVMLVLLSPLPQSQAANTTDACSGVNCQKGDCVLRPDLAFGFQCNCTAGWTQFMNISFLACGIPDCNLNFSCDGSSSPTSSPIPAPPASTSNACLFPGICGNGDCETVPGSGLLGLLIPSYQCNCHPGNANLLNMTSGLCIPSCSLGGSCQNLGIPLTPSPPSPPAGSPNENGVNSSACANVDCWEGKCEPANALPGFPQYTCNCDNGWLNMLNISFLACSVPNCKIPAPSCGTTISSLPRFSLPNITDILDRKPFIHALIREPAAQ